MEAPLLSYSDLDLDPSRATDAIASAVRDTVRGDLRRRGVVIGLSGGIDSSVSAALCVRALGPGRVFGLLMPERDSADDSLRLGRELAEHLGIASAVENVGPTLDAAGCYRRQLGAIGPRDTEAGTDHHGPGAGLRRGDAVDPRGAR